MPYACRGLLLEGEARVTQAVSSQECLRSALERFIKIARSDLNFGRIATPVAFCLASTRPPFSVNQVKSSSQVVPSSCWALALGMNRMLCQNIISCNCKHCSCLAPCKGGSARYKINLAASSSRAAGMLGMSMNVVPSVFCFSSSLAARMA